jgi:tetratricopeptide (TPR) repeat protein
VLSGVADPYELLFASLDEHAREDMVEAVLRRFAGKILRLVPGRDIDRLRLQPSHKPLLELIRAAPATLDELIAQAPLPAATSRRLLYALLACNVVAPLDARDTETFRSQTEARSAPPAPVSNGPPRKSEADAGSAAWQRLASLRPMGSLRPTPPMGSLRPTAGSNPPGNGSAQGASQSQVSLRATSLAPAADDKVGRQRRAEQLLQRARPDEVLAEIDALLALDAEHADLLALRAHALFDKYQGQAEGLPRLFVDALKKALAADPDHPRALYVKGMTYKRAGEPKKALAYFKRVLLFDPKHIEAAREVRLAKLRGS